MYLSHPYIQVTILNKSHNVIFTEDSLDTHFHKVPVFDR